MNTTEYALAVVFAVLAASSVSLLSKSVDNSILKAASSITGSGTKGGMCAHAPWLCDGNHPSQPQPPAGIFGGK